MCKFDANKSSLSVKGSDSLMDINFNSDDLETNIINKHADSKETKFMPTAWK